MKPESVYVGALRIFFNDFSFYKMKLNLYTFLHDLFFILRQPEKAEQNPALSKNTNDLKTA